MDAAERGPSSDETSGGERDSEWPRPTADVTRKSGIPLAPEWHSRERTFAGEGDVHAQLALAESTRTEANLNQLVKGLSRISAGAQAALEANAALTRELELMRAHLGLAAAKERALRRRVRLLEQALECATLDAARERAFFIQQEEAFLAELLHDHERDVEELRKRLERASTPAPPVAPEDADRETPIVPSAPSASTTRLQPVAAAATEIGAMKLRTVRVPAEALPPLDLQLAPLSPPRPSPSKPPLKQKPDPSTRPLVGYALGRGDVAEERVESSRKPSGETER